MKALIEAANQFPSRARLAGTDGVGRDFLSRLIFGARVSLTVGLSVQAIALLIGLTLGTLAGSFGSWVDYAIMRLVEVFTAVPVWLFALFLISVWRGLGSRRDIQSFSQEFLSKSRNRPGGVSSFLPVPFFA